MNMLTNLTVGGGKKTLYKLIKEDLQKLTKPTLQEFIRYIIMNASFKVTFWFRVLGALRKRKMFFLLYALGYLYYKHLQLITGIQLPPSTQIGGGLRFPHFSCIVINKDCIIGNNVTIFHGVTLGGNGGNGCPKVGNNVVIGANATIIGNVKIGDDVFVGAGSVVTKDIPNGAVVVGNPLKNYKL